MHEVLRKTNHARYRACVKTIETPGDVDDLDDDSRAELHAALDDALAEPDEQGMDVADLIAELHLGG